MHPPSCDLTLISRMHSQVLIAATNRPTDLDAALTSRFELAVKFPLPDEQTRKEILSL